jgi:hypothetical protein
LDGKLEEEEMLGLVLRLMLFMHLIGMDLLGFKQ